MSEDCFDIEDKDLQSGMLSFSYNSCVTVVYE